MLSSPRALASPPPSSNFHAHVPLCSVRGAVTAGDAGLARRGRVLFPPGGEALYRAIARELELSESQEFLVAPCGAGVTTAFLQATTGAAGAGVDPDAALVEAAAERARAAGQWERLHYDVAPADDLPYKDAVFDVVVGEIGVAAVAEPEKAVRELARVLRPRGRIALVQLAWVRRIDAERERLLVEHLGVRPYLLVEWKQMLRDAGIVDLRVEDWSDAAEALLSRSALAGGLAGAASLGDRAALLWRALRRRGWEGVRESLGWGHELRRLILRERVLELSLVTGSRWEVAEEDV